LSSKLTFPQPYLVGNTNYERGFYEKLAKARGETLAADFRPPAKDGCGSNVAAESHTKNGVRAWRYLYAGQFDGSNAPGAGHADEIALVFGTIENPPRKANSETEKALSLKLRTAWTEFAKDPAGGLLKLGWPLYDEASEYCVVERDMS
jgi:cholinesterase